MRAGEAQQRQQRRPVRGILRQAFLQDRAELLPEGRVFVRLVLREPRQHVEHALGETAPDRLHLRVLLQQLTRDVQRQIARIDHALDESQVQRQELLRIVHDEHTPHIQLQAPRGLLLPQVERRASGDIQQARVLALALHLVVAPGERLGEVVREVLIELLVLLG